MRAINLSLCFRSISVSCRSPIKIASELSKAAVSILSFVIPIFLAWSSTLSSNSCRAFVAKFLNADLFMYITLLKNSVIFLRLTRQIADNFPLRHHQGQSPFAYLLNDAVFHHTLLIHPVFDQLLLNRVLHREFL